MPAQDASLAMKRARPSANLSPFLPGQEKRDRSNRCSRSFVGENVSTISRLHESIRVEGKSSFHSASRPSSMPTAQSLALQRSLATLQTEKGQKRNSQQTNSASVL